jgi:hypothetical protein
MQKYCTCDNNPLGLIVLIPQRHLPPFSLWKFFNEIINLLQDYWLMLLEVGKNIHDTKYNKFGTHVYKKKHKMK